MARLPSQLTYNDLNGAEAVEVLVDWFRQLLTSQPIMQPHLTLPMAKITLDIGIAVDMYVGGTVPVASPPERLDITGAVTLSNQTGHWAPDARVQLSTVVNAAPIPGGVPPDQIREQHDLPIPRPGYGPRDTGSHLFLSDVTVTAVPPPQAAQHQLLPPASATGGRVGEVADGYVFSSEPVHKSVSVDGQTIPLANGEIRIDMTGSGIQHAGMIVKDDTHRRSVKEQGDGRGERYSSVNGVMDAGPAGLMSNRGSGGLYSDGRSRITFGNNHRG